MCFGRIVELIEYWKHSPPVHDLLAFRYLGPRQKGSSGGSGGSAQRSPKSEEEQVSQLPQIVGILGVPVRKMSEQTRSLYEYAQSVLKPKAEVK